MNNFLEDSDISLNKIFYNKNKSLNILKNKEEQINKNFEYGMFASILTTLSCFYIGGFGILFAIGMFITNILISQIRQYNILKKIFKEINDKQLLDLLCDKNFHKILFPYLTILSKKYNNQNLKEAVDNIKAKLINNPTENQLMDIKSGLESIQNLVDNYEKETKMRNYEKLIGVEVLLPEKVANQSDNNLKELL